MFFRNNIFDLQRGIPPVHPVQNFKSFSLLHHYWHNMKMHQMPKIDNGGLVPTIQPEPEFSQTGGFRNVFDNVELIMYI